MSGSEFPGDRSAEGVAAYGDLLELERVDEFEAEARVITVAGHGVIEV
jgi:hypothetical protein